jgi:Family of unknown function (DUF6879)
MHNWNTKVISGRGSYIENPKDFFGKFPDAWANVKFQTVKLETRQVYREPGNESYEAFESGDFTKAVRLLEKSRLVDVELYASLEKRGVDFIRCRPIVYPLSDYLKWEMECYKFNAKHGELIYFSEDLRPFDDMAFHDFMVFDREVALVHDYDDRGEIKGGWIVESPEAIDSLISLFGLIKAKSKRFEHTRAYKESL